MGRHWRNVEDSAVIDGITVFFLVLAALVFVAARWL